MRKWIIAAAAVVMAAASDQISKAWVSANLDLYENYAPIERIAPYFQLTRSSNTGAAFGILPMAGDVFLVAAFLIICALLWHLRGLPGGARLLPFAIGLVIGGAIGNVSDRLQHGHVIDFIHYQIPDVISNVSNLADHAIVFGVLLIIAESFWRGRQSRERASG